MASDGFLKVCTMEDLRVSRLGRLNISLNGRIVTVVVYKEKLYCMDTICYHAGGNLYKGDIEEVNGVPCLTCPIHHYRLSLKDGKQASFTYEVVDDKVGPCFLHFPPKEGTRQRVHPIKRVDDDVYVKLDDANKVLSDRLAFKKELLTQTGSRIHKVIGEAPPQVSASHEQPNRASSRPSSTGESGAADKRCEDDDDLLD